MDLHTNLAIQRYGDLENTAPAQPRTGTGSANPISEFSDIVARGEADALAALSGQGSTHQLVQSLAQTELAVEAVVTVRNKVVEAYQEILRMPV